MKDRYETTVLSSEQISKILPHRYPFLLVDRVVEFEAGKSNIPYLQIFSAHHVFKMCLKQFAKKLLRQRAVTPFSVFLVCFCILSLLIIS